MVGFLVFLLVVLPNETQQLLNGSAEYMQNLSIATFMLSLRHAAGGTVRPALLLTRGRRSFAVDAAVVVVGPATRSSLCLTDSKVQIIRLQT